MEYTYQYPRPAVTVDLVIFAGIGIERKVLLIQRARDPYMGLWAFPGGFVDENEDLADAAARELNEETGLKGMNLLQIGAFGKPFRDPRGHTITVAFLAVISHPINVIAGDDAANAQWFLLSDLPKLAFDHSDILNKALKINWDNNQ